MRRFIVISLLVAPLSAQELVTESDIILPRGLETDDQFGYAVDVDGDTLAISQRNGGGPTNGTVSIYVRSGATWVLQQELLAASGQNFGVAVALRGDRLAVGLPGTFDGAVDVYLRTGSAWSLEDRVSLNADGFGWDIDLDGDRLIVGAAREDGAGSDAGAAYVCERLGTSWQVAQQLLSPHVEQDDLFGSGVALDGDVAVVGAPGKSWVPGSRPGSAHVFRRGPGSWSFEQRVRSPAGDARFSFGRKVDVEGDLVVVGEPGAGLGLAAGAAHAFRFTGGAWRYDASLTAPDPRYNMQFGELLALHGGALLVGARYDKTVFLFEQNAAGWQQAAQIAPATSWWTFNENSIALDDTQVVVGNRYEPTLALQGGAVRIYPRPLAPFATSFCTGDVGLCPCSNESGTGALAGCAHAAGWGAQIVASGSASASADDLLIHGRAWEHTSPALLYASRTTQAPGPAGDGLLCLGGTPVRLEVDLGNELTWGPGLFAQCGATAGETWAFQVILRDPGGPCGSNVNWTQALAVTVVP